MPSGDSITKSIGEVPKLVGKENFLQWKQRITLALSLTRSSSFVLPLAVQPYPSGSSTLTPEQLRANTEWSDHDHQVAAAILSTTDESILASHIHLLDVDHGLAHHIYQELVRVYGNTGAQYSFALGRRFVENKCGEGEDVENWINQVQAQYRELMIHKFDLDALCVNVMLNGLPERFTSFVDGVWTATENPSIEDVRIAVLRINAGQNNRANEKALAARTATLDIGNGVDSDLKVFYAGLRRAGKGPSKEHPCSRCESHNHWVIDCPHPPTTNESSSTQGGRKWKKKSSGKPTLQAAVTVAPSSSNPKALAVTTFNDGSAFSHLLFAPVLENAISVIGASCQPEGAGERSVAVDITDACDPVSKMNVSTLHPRELSDDNISLAGLSCKRWILDSGASEHMTGDRSWFDKISPISST
ncbi:MAG: hypothetical protein TREMPRED_000191, partial [Tremellales sp. Tagirdzhanova-0007]